MRVLIADDHRPMIEGIAAALEGADGASNREIATELHVTGETVKSHLSNIYCKLGVANRTSAACTAFALGLLVTQTER